MGAPQQELAISEIIRYKLALLISGGIEGKFIFVLLVAVPLIVIFGILYSFLSKLSVPQAMYKAYGVLCDSPVADIPDDDPFLSRVVMNLCFLTGILTFAVVIGVVTDEIGNMVEGMKSGAICVAERNHTVVLNYNLETGPLLQQLAVAQKDYLGQRRRPVVVLADQDIDDLRQSVSNELEGTDLKVVPRSGSPRSIADLRGVSAQYARTLIVMQPEEGEGGDEDHTTSNAASLLALTAVLPGQQDPPLVVVQCPAQASRQSTYVSMASKALTASYDMSSSEEQPRPAASRVVQVFGLDDVYALMGRCAAYPVGLGAVYSNLLAQNADAELYILEDEFEGKTFREVRLRYPKATVCGMVDSSCNPPRIELSPSDTARFGPTDRAIALAPSNDIRAAPYKPEVAFQEARLGEGKAAKYRKPKNVSRASCPSVLVINFGELPEGLLGGVARSVDEKLNITVLGRTKPEEAPTKVGTCSVHWLEGSPLLDADITDALRRSKAGSIIITGLKDKPLGEADAQVMATLAQLQAISVRHERLKGGPPAPLHVVSQVHSTQTKAVAEQFLLKIPPKHRMTLDLLRPNYLVAGLITQTAAQPDILPVLSSLMSPEGSEIYVRQPAVLEIPDNVPVSWGQVEESARYVGEVAIGYIDDDGRRVM